jgi:hypothetical protein
LSGQRSIDSAARRERREQAEFGLFDQVEALRRDYERWRRARAATEILQPGSSSNQKLSLSDAGKKSDQIYQ